MILLIAIELIIFFSYLIISVVVLFVYVRHKSSIDSFVNRLLVITAGLFLMLCAITHIYSIWNDKSSVILSAACAFVSFVAMLCTLFSFRNLEDYLSFRIKTRGLIREALIKDLTEGYILRGKCVGNQLVSGHIGDIEIEESMDIVGEIRVNHVVGIGSQYFRLVSILDSEVGMTSASTRGSNVRSSDDVECNARLMKPKMVYGNDETAEIHMSQEEEKINHMKLALCMSTAHDVRTPLSSLGIVVCTLQSMCVDVECSTLLDEAYVNIEIINLVITQFMDIGKMNKYDNVQPTMDSFNIQSLVGKTEKVVRRLKNDFVEASVVASPNLPACVYTDVEWVWQILLNLVTNAAKYTYKGYISINIEFVDGNLTLCVKDTGIGIEDIDKPKIFDKYVTKQTLGHTSHGIGLYSVKVKIKALKGSYSVSDNPGGGSIFSVKIPVVKEVVHSEKFHNEDIDKKSCLVIDDTQSIRTTMKHLLRKHSIDTAVNGAEGLEKLQSKEYDIVFLDMYMPIMDGLECLKRFRRWEVKNRISRQLVYSMSANVVEVDDVFDGSISKPVDTERLINILSRLPPMKS